ncbi:MAG: hypothetical protein Kow0059_22120 [Candidatus Sumerlaeia bacterium]
MALLALVVRIVYLQLQSANPLFAAPALDELYHYQWASEIAQGRLVGERAFFRAPLYAYGLGALMALTGSSADASPVFVFYTAALFQHLIGAAAAVLIYLLALRLWGRPGVALTAMGLAALYGPALFFEGQLMDISLQSFLLPLVLLLAVRAFQRGRLSDFFLLGLAGGVSIVARPAALPWFVLIALLAPWLMRQTRPRTRRTKPMRKNTSAPADSPQPSPSSERMNENVADQAHRIRLDRTAACVALMLTGLILPVIPATLHNYLAEGVFLPVASYSGINFWIGNNRSADGWTSRTPDRYIHFGRYEDSVELFARERASAEAGRRLDSAEVSRYWFRQGLAEIAAAPFRWLGLMAKKIILFWNAFEIKNNKNIYLYSTFNPLLNAIMLLFNWGMLMPFGVVGLTLAARRSDPLAWRLYALMLLTLMGGVVMFFVNTRYRFPFAWLMLPFVAAGMAEIVDRVRALRPARPVPPDQSQMVIRRAVRRLGKAVGLLAAGFLFINFDFYHIRQSGDPAQDYWIVGNALKQKGKLQEAAVYYKRALEEKPDFSDAHNALGEVYYQNRDFNAAETSFSRALATAGNDRWARVRALNNLGVTAEARKQYESAVRYYEQALALAPEHALAWLNLGDAARHLKDCERAEQAYRQALNLSPRLYLAELGLAACEAQSSRLDEAEARLRKFLNQTGEAGRRLVRDTPELAPFWPELDTMR